MENTADTIGRAVGDAMGTLLITNARTHSDEEDGLST
jgi:hypothetical protein